MKTREETSWVGEKVVNGVSYELRRVIYRNKEGKGADKGVRSRLFLFVDGKYSGKITLEEWKQI